MRLTTLLAIVATVHAERVDTAVPKPSTRHRSLLAPHLSWTEVRAPLSLLELDRQRSLPQLSKLLPLRGGSGAAGPAVGNYNTTSVGTLVLNRGGWLNVFLLSLSLTSVVMSGFEHTLEKHIELAYFVPLLIGHGGNAGGQTVGAVLGAMSGGQACPTTRQTHRPPITHASPPFRLPIAHPDHEPLNTRADHPMQTTTPSATALSSLARHPPVTRPFAQVSQRDWAAVIAKECLTGLGAGTLTCAAVLPLLAVMKISRHVSAAILVTLPILTVFASGLGAALPFAVSALGADPTIIAAPAMTTLVDVGGLLAYFIIARLVFAAFGVKM